MNLLFDFIYAIALFFAWPILLVKSLRTGKYRSDWPARFGRIRDDRPLPLEGFAPAPPPHQQPRRLMIHCVSVGELLSMRHLVDRLLAADPRLELIITTTTDTGTTRARDLYHTPPYRGRVRTYRYPLDFSFAVESFLDHTQPHAIALVELETWPNFVRIAEQRRIPLCIINGRLTERSMRRYQLVRPVVQGMFRRVAWLGIQTDTIAHRFIALGAPRERIVVWPTLKYDTADLSDTIPGADQLAAALGIAAAHRLFVGGSTGAGEEAPLINTYLSLRNDHPDLRLAIAPRKPETVPQVIAAIRAADLTPVLRSEHPDGASSRVLAPDDIVVLDTLGELKKLYSLATVVFVGRSLVPLGGSDMIEVAALAKPCCFGPHAFNFAEAVELLTQAQGAVIVENSERLAQTIRRWLEDPAAARDTGQRGRAIIAAQRGSTERYVQRLLDMLRLTPPQTPL